MAEGSQSPHPAKSQTGTAAASTTKPFMPRIRLPGKERTYEERAANYIKATDSPFVRLSKQGGHKDLLKTELPVLEKPQPVPYPRNQWYYHLDNAKEDANNVTNNHPKEYKPIEDSPLQNRGISCKNNKWQQMYSRKDLLKVDFPEIVYKAADPVPYPRNEWYYYSDNAREDALKRASYVFPRRQAKPQEQGGPKNSKGVNIPTHGRRKGVPEKPVFNKPRMRNRNNSAQARVFGTMAAEVVSGQMEKIMANTYQEEWQQQANAYHQRLQAGAGRSTQFQSEYQRKYGPAVYMWQRAVVRHAAVKSRYRQPSTRTALPQTGTQSQTDGTKAPGEGKRFILSKFKKVGPKLDTRRKHTN